MCMCVCVCVHVFEERDCVHVLEGGVRGWTVCVCVHV